MNLILGEIEVTTKWRENKNQRIMIIYGDSLNNGINRNGQMDIISNPDIESYYHSTYLEKHAETNYTDDACYQKAIKKSAKTFCVYKPLYIQNTKYNNIVFTDTTDDFCDIKYGIIYFPYEEPTEEQYKTLKFLTSKLKEYKQLLIYAKPYIREDHLLDNEIYFFMEGRDIEELEIIMRNQYKIHNKHYIKKRSK